VVDQATGVSVGDPLLNCLPDVNLIGKIVPTRSWWELIDEAPSVRTDIVSVCHVWNGAGTPRWAQGTSHRHPSSPGGPAAP